MHNNELRLGGAYIALVERCTGIGPTDGATMVFTVVILVLLLAPGPKSSKATQHSTHMSQPHTQYFQLHLVHISLFGKSS